MRGLDGVWRSPTSMCLPFFLTASTCRFARATMSAVNVLSARAMSRLWGFVSLIVDTSRFQRRMENDIRADRNDMSSAAIKAPNPKTMQPISVVQLLAWNVPHCVPHSFDLRVQCGMIEVRIISESRDAGLDQHFQDAFHKHVAQELSFSTTKFPNPERFGRGNLV